MQQTNGLKILSCFDGIACGRVALARAGIPVTQYIASEIDKYAITVSRANHPDIIQGGDVCVIRKMAEAGFFGHIDLVIAGSPCQGFSFAGKQLAFNDPRSSLFFEFVAILAALRRANPNIKFLLENVKMKKEHLDVITHFLGVQPVLINSALLSAQNRQRYYWCNWSVEQPVDRGILLRDIIEDGGTAYLAKNQGKQLCGEINKATSLLARDYKGFGNQGQTAIVQVAAVNKSEGIKVIAHTGDSYSMNGRIHSIDGKSPALIANPAGGNRPPLIEGGAIRGRYEADGSTSQRLELNHLPKANAITTVGKDSVLAIKNPDKYLPAEITTDFIDPYNKKCVKGDKSTTLRTNHSNGNMWLRDSENITYRKLTPLECERLQTLPDFYTNYVSNSQRYKALGNGWTVDVVAHILRSMPA